VLRAIRDDVGDALELMVDCNQGWRMPWDTRRPWDVDHATFVGQQLAAERVYWMEEPLHRGDYAGMRELRARVDVRIAGGEMTREMYEFAELLRQDCLDVFQPACARRASPGCGAWPPPWRPLVACSRRTRGAMASDCSPTPISPRAQAR